MKPLSTLSGAVDEEECDRVVAVGKLTINEAPSEGRAGPIPFAAILATLLCTAPPNILVPHNEDQSTPWCRGDE